MDLVQRCKVKLVAIYKCADTCQLRAHIGAFYHGLVDRVGGFIRKDAGGQAGNNLDRANFMCCLQHVIVDVDIVSREGTDAAFIIL